MMRFKSVAYQSFQKSQNGNFCLEYGTFEMAIKKKHQQGKYMKLVFFVVITI
jgi:hypothetical protein